MAKVVLEEQTTPGTPAADKVALYPKAGGQLYKISDDGSERQLFDESDFGDAAADDVTKGIATFEADDFDDAAGKIDLADSVAKSVPADAGTATPSTHALTIAGGEGIDTSGAGSTVTITGEDASTANKGILPIATDAEALAATETAKAIVPSNLAALPIHQVNLLTNSGFGVWSNSALTQGRTIGQQSNSFDVGAAILDNDGTAIGSWNGTTTRCTVAVGGGIFTMTDDGTGTTMETSVDLVGLTIGKLYKFSATLDNGTGTWAVGAGAGLQVEPNGGGANIAYVASETEVGFESYSVIWEATETNNRITFVADVGVGETVDFDDVYVIEVTPGCVAADALGPDGWTKSGALGIYREHNGSNTKDGSFYSLKVVGGNVGIYVIDWNGDAHTKEEFFLKFRGRSITFGCWVKTDTANHFRLNITDKGGSNNRSSTHLGGDDWEWLETTANNVTDNTWMKARFEFLTDNTTYISQPILAFGSSIGEGNYSAPPGEIVWLEQPAQSNILNEVNGHSTTGWTDLNVEADTDGMISKGISALCLGMQIRDSNSGADANVYLTTRGNSTIASGAVVYVGGLANIGDGARSESVGWTQCDSSGNIQYNIQASGAGTFDTRVFEILAVQIRG